MPDFDLAVIGAGAAGLTVTAVAAQLGLRVVLIERGRMGGDCLNSGCVPSKALLASAHAAQMARNVRALGVDISAVEVDWPAVHAHVQGVIAEIAPMDSAARFAALGAQVLQGTARFTARDALAVDAQGSFSARRIVIAAGSRAAIPPIPGLADEPFLTNETLFDASERPEHLLILGGGPIGVEMAQAHAALGSRVTVVEANRLLSRDDPELVDGLRQSLIRAGVDLREGAEVRTVAPGPTLVLADGSRLRGSHLLVATGRTPNLAALDLSAGGVAATSAGITTDRGLRSTTNPRVFAAGDIAAPDGLGPRAFTHVGSYHAGIIIRRALFRLPARLDYRALPRVTYTDPELAQVGLTEAEAPAGSRVLRWPLADNDRARAERRPEGLVKLIATPGGRILGAGLLAPNAGEMIGMWALAIQRKIPLATIAGMILPYPTRGEAGKRAAGQFFAERLLAPFTRRLASWLARLP